MSLHPNPDVAGFALEAAQYGDESVANAFLRDMAKRRAGVELTREEAGTVLAAARKEARRSWRADRANGNAESERPRLRVLDGHELFALPVTPQRMLVRPHLPHGRVREPCNRDHRARSDPDE